MGSFTDQVRDSLREENQELESKNRSLQSQVRRLENEALGFSQRVQSAESVRGALYDAVRVLAGALTNRTAQGRRAREVARAFLESSGITPPGTLGSSRKRKRRKRKT